MEHGRLVSPFGWLVSGRLRSESGSPRNKVAQDAERDSERQASARTHLLLLVAEVPAVLVLAAVALAFQRILAWVCLSGEWRLRKVSSFFPCLMSVCCTSHNHIPTVSAPSLLFLSTTASVTGAQTDNRPSRIATKQLPTHTLQLCRPTAGTRYRYPHLLFALRSRPSCLCSHGTPSDKHWHPTCPAASLR
jgi:hypothetical protein